MPVDRPFFRTCRQFVGNRGYVSPFVSEPGYAQSPEHYVRAFLILQKDLLELFDYVEPADENGVCYSYRLHQLLLRACVEVEANLKAIMIENGYRDNGQMGMSDYCKVEASHRLSAFAVRMPTWHGASSVRTPFAAWSKKEPLRWYQAYNVTKHSRQNEFSQANFDNAIDAVCGLLVVLSAQFWKEDFTSPHYRIVGGKAGSTMEAALGDYFQIRFPDDWEESERYDFDWEKLKKAPEPFQKFDFMKVPAWPKPKAAPVP